MGIRSVLLLTALALAAAEFCTEKHKGIYGIWVLDVIKVPLPLVSVPAGTWNINITDDDKLKICDFGFELKGLNVRSCTEYLPRPVLDVPNVQNAILTTQSPATVNLTASCQSVWMPRPQAKSQVPTPVVISLSQQHNVARVHLP